MEETSGMKERGMKFPPLTIQSMEIQMRKRKEKKKGREGKRKENKQEKEFVGKERKEKREKKNGGFPGILTVEARRSEY